MQEYLWAEIVPYRDLNFDIQLGAGGAVNAVHPMANTLMEGNILVTQVQFRFFFVL